MRTFYVYLFEYKTWPAGTMQADVFAEPEQNKDTRFKFLFSCREEWLPKDREQLIRACNYHKQTLPANFDWYGYVPF